MKKNFFVILILCFLFPIFSTYGDVPKKIKVQKAVINDLGGGRFGDQCLSYMHAKWISYHYGIPLLLEPFLYSNELYVHYLENKIKASDYSNFGEVIRPSYGDEINYAANVSALYMIPYFPDAAWELVPENRWYTFPIDWKDPGFKKELKRMIRPIKFTPQIEIPDDRISVAVHVRLGGGFDSPITWKFFPLKLPPLSFYKEQIRNMYEILGNQPMFVYVFTDDYHPERLVDEFKEFTADLDIQYVYRESGNNDYSNVMQDLFEMVRFDCLIRPQSNYSIVAAKLADYKVVISPTHFVWDDFDNNEGHVDEVLVEQ